MRLKKISHIVSLLSLILFSASIEADEYFAETDFFGESPVVLTVSRMHKPLADSPASVTVIDRQMIRNSGAREIADIFRMVPGFVVGYLYNNRPVVTYHGFGQEYGRQLQVLIDGRSVFIPSFGGVPWSNLPLSIQDIERIEVIRGPNSVTYGANAFLATINIITHHAAEDLGGTVSVTQDIDSDSSSQNLYLRYGDQLDDFDWRITAGIEKDDGYSSKIDDEEVHKFNLRTDFMTAHNQFWSIQAGINQGVFQEGQTGSDTDPVRDEETENYFFNIKWELIENSVQTTAKLTQTNHSVNNGFDIIQPGFFSSSIRIDRKSQRSDLEIYQNRSLSNNLSVNYGISARQDKVKSFFLFHDDSEKTIDTKNFFSSLEWRPLDDLIIDVGLFIEDTDLTSAEDSYRLSIIKKTGQHSIRFVSSSAIRQPVLWELTGNITFDALIDPSAPAPYNIFGGMTIPFEVQWINTGDLKPESILSNEIGIFSEYLNHQLSTDLKLFQYEISRQISSIKVTDSSVPVTDDDQQYRTMANGGKTQVEGLELSFNYSPLHRTFRIYGGLSALHISSFEADSEESVPEKLYFLGGHYQFTADQQLSVSLYGVDEFSWADKAESIDGYTKLDLRHQFTLDSKNQITLELIHQNLYEEYRDYTDEDTHKQTFLVRVSGQF